jgi:hypothetical protein
MKHFSVDGSDISLYSFECDESIEAVKTAKELFLEHFEVKADGDAGKIKIFICQKGENTPAGKEGFLIQTKNGDLEILCSYENALVKTLSEFLNSISENYEVSKNELLFKKDVSVVYYEDFPEIKGDGVTDDFEAIKKLHEYANRGGQKVVCQEGKGYYIKAVGKKSIVIKTDVDFGGATFIIDDSFVEPDDEFTDERRANVFLVENDYDELHFDSESDIVKKINAAGGIRSNDTTLPLNLGYKALIIPQNQNKRMYMRWGQGGKTGPGAMQAEVMLVHENNEIDKNTPVLFEFEELTDLVVRRADTRSITLSGGLFITLAARYNVGWPPFYYTSRNMLIKRPNTTISGLEHRVIEGEHKVFYHGFIDIEYANNVEVRDCKLSGRGGTGTYDISVKYANDVRFLRCTQYNMFMRDGRVYDQMIYWGIMGSNYSKNLTYDSCTLSRFDAHAGVYNFTIRNCEIAQINATGGGTALIENTKIHRDNVVVLREDYGAFWIGDIIVKNVELIKDADIFTVTIGNLHDVDYGFETKLPNIYVENLTLRRYDGTEVVPSMFTVYSNHAIDESFVDGIGKFNKIHPAKKVVIKQPSRFAFTKIHRYDDRYKAYDSVEYLPFEENETK